MPDESITPEQMRKWNKLIDFMKEKGYAGKVELDHSLELRKKILNEFNTIYPSFAVPEEAVKDVQQELMRYKEKAIENIKQGRGQLAEGQKIENFMSSISQVDGILGQKTSQWKFPEAYIIDNIKKQSLGYANKVDLTAFKKP